MPEDLNALETSLKELIREKEDSIKTGDFAEASLIQKEQEAVSRKIEL